MDRGWASSCDPNSFSCLLHTKETVFSGPPSRQSRLKWPGLPHLKQGLSGPGDLSFALAGDDLPGDDQGLGGSLLIWRVATSPCTTDWSVRTCASTESICPLTELWKESNVFSSRDTLASRVGSEQWGEGGKQEEFPPFALPSPRYLLKLTTVLCPYEVCRAWPRDANRPGFAVFCYGRMT